MSEEKRLVQYQTDHGEVKLSPGIVRKYLVSGGGSISDQEVDLFMKLCQYQRLNPFLREAYCVKYGSEPATIITGKDVFHKRAAKNELFDGMSAGVIVLDEENNLIHREGGFTLPNEHIMGAWAKAYRKDWQHPASISVSMEEYMGRKRDGSPNKQWATMPGTMIVKVAKVQALREAFPEDFQGLYDAAEMGSAGAAPPPQSPAEEPAAESTEEPTKEPEDIQGEFEKLQDTEEEQPADEIETVRNEARALLHDVREKLTEKQAQIYERQIEALKASAGLNALMKNLARMKEKAI